MRFFTLTGSILFFLVGLFVLLGISFTTMFLKTHREYEFMQGRERIYEKKIAHLRRKVASRENYLNLVLNDPEFLEHVIRRKLGYARKSEMIFRFEERSIP